jgi:hypothetical protein
LSSSRHGLIPHLKSSTTYINRIYKTLECGQVLRFPLPIFIPPITPQSPSSIIWGLYNRPGVAAVPSGLSPTPLIIIKKILSAGLS